MTNQVPSALKKYRSHKVVEAMKIVRIERHAGGAITLYPEDNRFGVQESAEYVSKHSPAEGGYYVRYEDGYTSWSPSEAFEGGYTLLEDAA